MSTDTATEPRCAPALEGPDPSHLGRRERALRTQLIAAELLTAAQLDRAQAEARRTLGSLEDAIVDTKLLDRCTVLAALESLLNVPSVDLAVMVGDPSALTMLPTAAAFEYDALPLWCVDGVLTVALTVPEDLARLDVLRFVTGQSIQPCVALERDLRRALTNAYGDPYEVLPDELEFEVPGVEASRAEELEIDSDAGAQPIVQLVNRILVHALSQGASDLHLEPRPDRLAVRLRVDGLLRETRDRIPLTAARPITSRLKVLAKLDISERRRPQDGGMRLAHQGRQVDVRMSTFPTVHGEKAVLRLLDKRATVLELDQLGLAPGLLRAWRELAGAQEGLLLACGPTGSGKTTTLHATLASLASAERNLVSLEDPVEYEVPGVSQGQVDERAGFTFARGLRSILRQDPDVILVGEIRDSETARIAVQASLTGHLVLSTVHSNDAVSAVTRLIELELPPYLVASSLLGALAQRLLRRACPDCLSQSEPNADETHLLAPWLEAGEPFLHPTGCPTCDKRGFRGRIAIHELVELTPEARALVASGTDGAELALHDADASLWQDGLRKVRSCKTTLRELARVVRPPRIKEASSTPEG